MKAAYAQLPQGTKTDMAAGSGLEPQVAEGGAAARLGVFGIGGQRDDAPVRRILAEGGAIIGHQITAFL
jgi:hypothetical protein